LVRRNLETAEVGFGLFEMREETLLGLEFAGVNAAASGLHADGMLEVQHLVVEQILDGAARSVGAIEDAADHDGIVGRVIVAEHAAGVVRAPGEDRASEKTMEEARIQRIEDLIQIKLMTYGSEDALPSAGLADVLGLTRDGFRRDVATVAIGVCGGDGFLVKLCKQDMRYSVVDGLGGVLEDVGEADVKTSLAKPDGGVERGEAAETDVEGRDGGTWPEGAILLFKDGDKRGEHGGFRLTWL
jgi:hypothetical protein